MTTALQPDAQAVGRIVSDAGAGGISPTTVLERLLAADPAPTRAKAQRSMQRALDGGAVRLNQRLQLEPGPGQQVR